MKEEAQFLLDRLDEYDPEDADHVRDFHGHVAPAIARLRSALAEGGFIIVRETPEMAHNLIKALREEGYEIVQRTLNKPTNSSP